LAAFDCDALLENLPAIDSKVKSDLGAARIASWAAYSTALGHLFHEHVASHSMTCGHSREVICEAVYS
jgi:hypothetical protein